MATDKNAVIKEAQKFAAKGQFDKAIAEWKKLIKESPNDANIFNTIGDLCLKKDAKPEAVDAYQKAADILAADGFTSKAIALYKKVLNIDPKKMEAHLALGDLNAEKGLTGNALESYKLVADHFNAQKETAKALGIYQKMADLNPSNSSFRLKLADMYAKAGMKPQASKAYLEAADVHVSKNAFQEARHIFEKVLALDPSNKEVYFKAGVVYVKEGKFVEACKAFKPAFEADPANQELIDLYLEALGKAGRASETEDVLTKLVSANAGNLQLREKLYRHYLSKKEYEKALAEASSLVGAKIQSKDIEGAERILRDFSAQSPEYDGGRRALGEFYVTNGRPKDAAKEFLEAAVILKENGDVEGAKAVLTRAVELAPDQSEAKQLLESLQPKAAAPGPEAPEAEIPIPVFPGPTIEPVVSAPTGFVEEGDPVVTEAFTEVDVLIKYGLLDKALEQLEGLAIRFPVHPQVRTRLRELYRDQGKKGKSSEHAVILAEIYALKGDKNQADAVLRSALELDPGNEEIMAKLGIAPPPERAEGPSVPAPPTVDELVLDTEAPQAAAGEAPDTPDLITGLEMAPDTLEAETAALTAGTEQLVLETPGEKTETALPEEAPISPVFTPEKTAIPAGGPPAEKAPPLEADISEIRAEAEFYYQQGLFEEAQKHYEKILDREPTDKHALDRMTQISREKEESREFSKLAEAVEGLEGLVPEVEAAAETSPSASDEEAVRSLMQEIEQLKKPPAPQAEEPVAPQPAEPQPPRADEDFFDLGAELREESERKITPNKEPGEDFFDLAAELRDELAGVEVPATPAAVSADEQSLDDIFEEFKKGVEQQAVKEDLDTHYNLGVAYKEMGLLDDAIAEFILAPEGEPKFVQSRYMLGLCFMEKGEYPMAIVEIRNALNYSESLGGEAVDRLGMHYDLGLALQGAGNTADALAEFQKVYEVDAGYRDVSAKVKELQEGDFISLEQLKNDIEKEISSKFMEEGERIEREEKTRKNEKVRS